MISYSLTKNTMKPDTTEFIATIKQSRKTDLDRIIDYMVSEGTGLTRPQALAYFEKLMQTFEHFIEESGGISIPLFRIRLTIKGVFRNKGDSFDSERHKINIRIIPGPRLNNLKERLKLTKINSPKRTPNPESFIDAFSQTTNSMATQHGIATLKGDNLKFDPNDVRQGVFFIPEKEPKANIRVDFYSSIKTTETGFLIPALPSGKYTVVVQAIMKNHTSVRGGVLHPVITVY